MHRRTRIYVAGGDTLIGAALIAQLRAAGRENLVGLPPHEPDLADAVTVEQFFAAEEPEYVFLAAGRSGGIHLNQTRPADLMRDNLLVAAHILPSAARHGVKKLLYLASSCAYPRLAPQPLREEMLLSGPLEPTNEAYAQAKLAGVTLSQAYRRQYGAPFITAIPANAFGPHDDFGPESGHVIPALIRRFDDARLADAPTVTVWGTGSPRREFVFARDLADACIHVMCHYDAPEPINVGGGVVLSIAETAFVVADVVGYRGRIVFDPTHPDGMPLKALDSSKLRALGWRRESDFHAGLRETYDWYLKSGQRSAFSFQPDSNRWFPSSGLGTSDCRLADR